jgi:hypothetical protein
MALPGTRSARPRCHAWRPRETRSGGGSLGHCGPGTSFSCRPAGGRGSPSSRSGLTPRDPRPLVLTERRWAGRLSMLDFPVAVESIGSVRVPRHFNHRSPQERRDLAAALRRVAVPPGPSRRKGSPPDADEEVARLRAAVRAHPCHGCPDRDEHARWAERYRRLQRENAGLVRRVEGRTDSLGRTFDQICELLDQRGYLAGDEATPAGRRLARIWSESDLVVAECLRDGVWDALDPAELAAVVSTLVTNSPRQPAADRMPSPAFATRLPPPCGCGATSPRTRPSLACRRAGNRNRASSGRCTAGPGARVSAVRSAVPGTRSAQSCLPATSSDGANRSSICWIRSRPRPARRTPQCPNGRDLRLEPCGEGWRKACSRLSACGRCIGAQ